MAETVALVTLPVLRFLGADGLPLAGAKLYSYEAGTTTPKALYTEDQGIIAHANPAIANAAGQLVAYAITDEPYKLDLFDANDVHQAGWPIDNYVVTSVSAGTFIPNIAGGTTVGSGTYGNRIGRYQRSGRLVTYTIYMEVEGHTGTGNLYVRGFPFEAQFGGTQTVMFYSNTAEMPLGGPILAYLREPTPTVEIYGQFLNDGTIDFVDLQTVMTGVTGTVFVVLSGNYVTT